MKTSDFYYDLPEELIAQTPLAQRDTSRLMTVDRQSGAVEHHHFHELPDFLKRIAGKKRPQYEDVILGIASLAFIAALVFAGSLPGKKN